MDNTLSLKVDEVLRGTNCKAGDVLDVKLPQTMLVEFPRLVLVEEFQGGSIDKKLVIPDLNKAYVYFFPQGKLVLDRPSQIRPDWHNGWKQALAGQPINLSFRLFCDIDSEMSKQAATELFETRDRQVIDDLIEASGMSYGIWTIPPLPFQWYVRRTLRGLGDENGDVYDAAWKALTTKASQNSDYAHFLTHLLAQIDSKRAPGDLKKLLNLPRVVAKESVIWAMACLENRGKGSTYFSSSWLWASSSAAHFILQNLMWFSTAQPTSMVKLAKLQNLAARASAKTDQRGEAFPRTRQPRNWLTYPPTALLRGAKMNPVGFRNRDYPDYRGLRPRPTLGDWNAIVNSAGGNLEPLLTKTIWLRAARGCWHG